MAALVRLVDGFHGFFERHGDPRTNKWFLMSSPVPTILICLTYVYIVKVLGPKLMANRKPFVLREVLIVYNLFQVVFSAWLFYEAMMGGWWDEYSLKCQPVNHSTTDPKVLRLSMSGWLTGHYSFKCQPLDRSTHPRTMRMAAACWWYFISKFSEFCDTMVNLCWWYYFSKFTEFFDTFFFVLRKKQNQVSTLHVIHHGVMPMSVWFGVKFTPGGHSTFFGLLNTFVHIVMYAYYFLAALGPHMTKYLWWKKYLTTLQLIQFVAIMVHAFQLLFIDCNFPKAFVWWIGSHAVMFFFLFRNFYKEQYVKPQAKAKVEPAISNGHASTDQNGGGAVTKQNGFSKQSDYYINGEVSRPELVQRSAAAKTQ